MLNPQDVAPESRLVSPLEWVTVDRLAALLDVRVDHLRSLVQRREIPFGRVGKLVRFHWPTIQRWVTSAAGFTASKPQPGVSPGCMPPGGVVTVMVDQTGGAR